MPRCEGGRDTSGGNADASSVAAGEEQCPAVKGVETLSVASDLDGHIRE